ncbi:MAG: OFA family MFS transporter [Geobacteraceae bacterium]|nr:OFA family MFS transporter [Geobacteraceae bacterium]
MSNENLMSKRWIIAIAGILILLLLGTLYGWSVFAKAIMDLSTAENLGWTKPQIQTTFMIIIGVIGAFCSFGGILVDKKGPKFVMLLGAAFYGAGVILGGLALKQQSLMMLYLGYGVIGGIGNGLGYVVPIATLIRWFPDRRALVTGLAVMGFGFGAFFIGKLAPMMIKSSLGLPNTFMVLGVIYLVGLLVCAFQMQNPPSGWLPDGFTPPVSTVSAADSFSWAEAKKTPQWYMIWFMLFCNVTVGMGIVSQIAPIASDLFKKANTPGDIAALAGGVVAIASIFNGLGRLFWPKLSDYIGRKGVMLIMFATQAVIYIYLPALSNPLVFKIIACYLLSCLGGGFAVMPTFAADSFGPTYIGKVYGFILSAWGAAGLVGVKLFAIESVTTKYYVSAGVLAAGFVVAALYTRPKHVSHYKAVETSPGS